MMKTTTSMALAAILGTVLGPAQATDGIQRLQGVTQQKAQAANENAAANADKQRALINKPREAGSAMLRPAGPSGQLPAVQSPAGPSIQLPAVQTPLNPALRQQLLQGLAPANELQPRLARLGVLLREMQQVHSKTPRDTGTLRAKGALARTEIAALRELSGRLATGFAGAEGHVPSKGGKQATEQLRAKLEGMLKDLEAQDKLGNFEIQDLMSQYNQAEQMASSVMKKRDDTTNGIIGKIG